MALSNQFPVIQGSANPSLKRNSFHVDRSAEWHWTVNEGRTLVILLWACGAYGEQQVLI